MEESVVMGQTLNLKLSDLLANMQISLVTKITTQVHMVSMSKYPLQKQ